MTDETPPVPAPPVPTSLIYLDVDDEITSAAARIRGAGTEKIGVVLPYGSRLATSRINFRLLAREADERSKRIEIICGDASARALAQAAGLTVHPSVAAFEGRVPNPAGVPPTPAAVGIAAGGATGAAPPEDAEKTKPRAIEKPRAKSPKVPVVGPPRPPMRTRTAAALGVALLVLALLGAYAAITFLPTATILLHPRSEAIRPLELTIEARTDAQAPDGEALVIPAERITFQLSSRATFPATGKKTVETKATGNVLFSNFDTGGGTEIAAGSIVKTPSGVQFKTLATVSLPNATIQFPFTIVPSTSSVGIEALEAGPQGNVGNNTITVVPKGKNKNLLKVTNTEATSGGGRTDSTVVSQGDIDAGIAAITAALGAQLDQQIGEGTGVPAGVTTFPETRALGSPAWEVDPATLVGTEVADFELAATGEGTVIGVDPAPILEIARSRIDARVTEGWSLIDTSVVPTIGTPTVLGEVVSYPVTIAGTQVHDVDRVALLDGIRGLVLAEARAKLDDYGDVDITLWPDWATAIPTRPDRITFDIGAPQPSASPAP
jgi:hypothetical protein